MSRDSTMRRANASPTPGRRASSGHSARLRSTRKSRGIGGARSISIRPWVCPWRNQAANTIRISETANSRAMAAWSKRRSSGAGPALRGFKFSDNLSMRHASDVVRLRRVYRLICALTTPPENDGCVELCHDGLDKSG